jgi:DNA-binding transcriptional ArsR family regulator
LAYPARVWALLLDLDDTEGRGTRRVRQAIAALADAKLIEVLGRSGQPNRITLLDEGGNGVAYRLPGDAYNKARGTGEEWRHRYIQIPDTLWTNGWVATLSGAALAMLLVLFGELGQRDATKTDIWFSPSRAQKIYGLSEDTRSKGLRELRAAELITARKRAVSRDVLDFRRLRNTYRLELDKLNEKAVVLVGINPPRPLTPSQVESEKFLSMLPDSVRPKKT